MLIVNQGDKAVERRRGQERKAGGLDFTLTAGRVSQCHLSGIKVWKKVGEGCAEEKK